MPQSNRPISDRPKVEDSSTGDPEKVEERHGKSRQEDTGMPGKGSEKGGLNKDAGTPDEGQSGSKQSRGPKQGP